MSNDSVFWDGRYIKVKILKHDLANIFACRPQDFNIFTGGASFEEEVIIKCKAAPVLGCVRSHDGASVVVSVDYNPSIENKIRNLDFKSMTLAELIANKIKEHMIPFRRNAPADYSTVEVHGAF